jgi:hypothetical protein
MKTIEYLQNLPKGAIVNNKRALAIFKKLGLIYDYSAWGYLESQNVYYMSTYNGKTTREHIFTYSGKPIQNGQFGSVDNPFSSSDEMFKHYSYSLNFEYKGMKFSSKYLDGCFNAYLEKVSDNENKQTVNPRNSLFGAII